MIVEQDNDDGTSYISQPDAADYCSNEFGSHLASFHSGDDLESYWQLSTMYNKTNMTCWVGLYYNNGENTWKWQDESNFNYSNWSVGYPTDESNREWYE